MAKSRKKKYVVATEAVSGQVHIQVNDPHDNHWAEWALNDAREIIYRLAMYYADPENDYRPALIAAGAHALGAVVTFLEEVEKDGPAETSVSMSGCDKKYEYADL